MDTESKLETWIAQGEMDIDRIFLRMDDAINNIGYEFDSEKKAIRVNFSSLCNNIDGTPRLTEVAFRTFLHGRGAIPPALMGTTSIIFQSMRYLSQVPFSQQTLPEALTMNELCRAIIWPNYNRSRYLCDGLDERTPADYRRIMFQSLATTEDGKKLPLDIEDWKKQAERRAVELPLSLASRAESRTTNCDDAGDEMFHDALTIMHITQPDIDSTQGNVSRDCFRSLAKQYQGGGFHLNELSIPPGELHALVKLLLIAQFGPYDHLEIEGFSDLDQVTSCVVKAFHQDANMDITWPMFDDAAKGMPCLFKSFCHILSNFMTARIKPNYYTEDLLPGSGTLLTFPLLCQLSIILHDNICWEDFKQLHSYKPDGKLSEATAISEKITSVHGVTVLFIFGKIVETGEDAIFGAFISEPSKDGSSIQPRKDEHDDLLSCFLFELSPMHDVSWGNVGRPGWSATGDGELCFGENGNGAALVLGKRLKTASLIRTVEQQDPSFTANAWRGKTSVQLDVEAIELWAELSPYQDDESDYDDSGYDGSSYVGSSYVGSSYDDSSYDDSSNDDSGSSDSGDDASSDDGSD